MKKQATKKSSNISRMDSKKIDKKGEGFDNEKMEMKMELENLRN